MAKKSFKHITDQDFKSIKALLESGVSVSVVAKATGRAYTTVRAIYKTSTVEEYKMYVSEYHNKKREVVDTTPKHLPEELEVAEEPQRTRFSSDSVNLDRIATALERMADAWENKPKRKLF